MASSASQQEEQPHNVTLRAFRNTWKAMNEFGNEFERKHFDGDLLRKVGEATRNTIDTVNEWKEEMEKEFQVQGNVDVISRWRYSPPDGLPIAVRASPDITGARTDRQLTPGELVDVAEERLGTDGVVYLRLADGRGWLFDQKPGVGVLCVREEVVAPSAAQSSQRTGSSTPAAASDAGGADVVEEENPQPSTPAANALYEEMQRLQKELNEAREQRRGRAAALRVLDEAMRPLRAELAEEPALFHVEESERCVVEHRARAVERAFTELQERQHQLLSRRASLEAEVQRHNLEVKRAERSARERADGKVREWARDGPEMEALKNAKVELAQLLGQIDQDRLSRRRELRDLMAEVEAAQLERDGLRQKEVYIAPKGSFLSSMRRLWTVAKGRDDPFPNLESRVP